MTKEEKIQEAWGIHYASDIDNNGYRTYKEFEKSRLGQWEDNLVDKGFNEISKNYWVRPFSLQGIENNNGWIKIESEDDLPKENGIYWVMKKGYTYPTIDSKHPDDNSFWIAQFTHYQQIIKPNLPIY
jgi:hypothetical protein